MNPLSALVMGIVGFIPLIQYHWLTGGEFSLIPGSLLLTGGWVLSLLAGPTCPRRRYILLMAGGWVLPWILRGVVMLIALPLAGKGHYGYIGFDTDFFLNLPLYYLIFPFCWFSWSRPGEAPLLLSLIMLLAGGGILIYEGDPGRIASMHSLAGAGVFLFAGIVYLALFRQRSLYHRRSLARRGEGTLIILLLFLPALVLLLRSYEEKSVAEGGGLLQNDLFQFDFSDVLTLQPDIAMSDELVMLFRKEGNAEKMLIRRHVLDRYDREKGFYREEDDQTILPGGLKLDDPGYENRTEVLQEYYLINMNPSATLGLNYPVEIEAFRKWEDSSFQRVLRTLSMVENRFRRDLSGIDEISMERKVREPYVDYGGREDIAELALSVTEGVQGPYGKARAVEQYLKNNYTYSLKPGISLNGDQLGYFLFVSKKGYCSYFAFAMTLMLRSLDIPARVAVGFWVDPESEVLNFYPVKANQAHAWVEVYFNEKGWIEFDPTSDRLAEGEDFSFGSVDRELYNNLIEEIIHHEEELIPEESLSFKESMESSLRKSSLFLEEWGRRMIGSAAVLYLLLLSLLRRTPLSGRRSGARKRAVAVYITKIKQLHRAGYPGKSGETPWEYAGRVEEAAGLPLRELTRLYLKAEFSPRFDGKDREVCDVLVKEYSRRWKKVHPARRLLALLYPLPQIRRYI